MAYLDKDNNNKVEWKEFKDFLKIYYLKEEKFRKFILALYEPNRLKWWLIYILFKKNYKYKIFKEIGDLIYRLKPRRGDGEVLR